jgi:hypothetical protein
VQRLQREADYDAADKPGDQQRQQGDRRCHRGQSVDGCVHPGQRQPGHDDVAVGRLLG